jgi:hypothetical protein
MKKYLAASFALVLAIGFTAFTAPKNLKFTDHYYTYNGTGDQFQESSYISITVLQYNASSCTTGVNTICVIDSPVAFTSGLLVDGTGSANFPNELPNGTPFTGEKTKN